MATARVTRLLIRTAGSTARVTRVRVRNPTPTTGAKARVTRFRVRNPNVALWSLSIAGPSSSLNLTPFEDGSFIAVTPLTPDSWAWSITGGVPLAGATTDTVTFTGPALPVPSALLLTVTVTKSGLPDLTKTATISVTPHAGLFRQDGSGVLIH